MASLFNRLNSLITGEKVSIEIDVGDIFYAVNNQWHLSPQARKTLYGSPAFIHQCALWRAEQMGGSCKLYKIKFGSRGARSGVFLLIYLQ
jgi:hypothetical protein